MAARKRPYFKRASREGQRRARADAIAAFEQFCCEQIVRLDTARWNAIEREANDEKPLLGPRPGAHGDIVNDFDVEIRK